jgi:diguanylate cyclase (GGDEF)-like protein/PAS domain S-box-containing protein
VARNRGQFDVVAAVPGARNSLRWYGWLGLALLVIPAVLMAALAQAGNAFAPNESLALPLAVTGLLALTGTALLLARILSGLRRLAELAQLLCERSHDPVFIKDAQHRYRFLNEAAAALLGRRAADANGKRDSELQPGAEALAYEENDRVCLERDLPTMFRETQKLPGGGERIFLVSKYPLHDTRGRISGLVGAARNITDELELQRTARRRADEHRAWFDLNPLPVVVFASSGLRILAANAAAEHCYGYGRARLQQMQVSELFDPAEADRLHAYLREDGRPIGPGSVAWKHRRAGGEAFDVLTDIGNLPHEDVPSRVMIVRDVSAESAMKLALGDCEKRYEDLLESGLSLVWMHDLEGRLLKVNSAMANALGYERADMVGRPLSDFVAEEAQGTWVDYMNRTRNLARDAGVLHFIARDGERRVWQYRFVCYPNAEPVPYVMGAAQDVTLRRRYELRLRDQNQRDPLTGCRTRRFLDAFALQAAHDQSWGCVLVDIDYFRQLNASEGRARGDELLREMAALLDNSSGSGDVVVRLGADEFAVLMPQATENTVRELAERLGAASRDGMPAVFSLGWAVREEDESLESTLRRADKMLLRSRARR